MAQTPQNPSDSLSGTPDSSADTANLIQLLRRKQGNWVEWGEACAQLQKSGYNPQQIFEETGFEPIQQNQVIVAAQVFSSLVKGNLALEIQSYFQRKGSDILYEFRILNQGERVRASEFANQRQLDADEAKELAKAIKEFSRFSTAPDGFSHHPGDILAYYAWKAARQHHDLQQRSRLIAKGLKYAHSPTAREKIEQLLTDFSVTTKRSAPRLPIYRLETEEDIPRLIPVAGEFPISLSDFNTVPLMEEIGKFRIVKSSGNAAWVAVPGWQVVMKAEDPVAILGNSANLPHPLPNKSESVLIIVDRAQRQWDTDAYFLVEGSDHLELQWFDENPSTLLLGKLILVVRPKKVLDEDQIHDVWQTDE
ncbi:RuBisCO accumulation factor 1 [Planktothrix sp. FACHB-1365]|uniref:RuBisCO accumulation factor 1 n=1 Tax=Planktothrix sp. FACHB-1365 TaxID=2692855 RepID=UPI001683F53B|nr:RuBisCO accumulation factor 1 [Planktothrix sp. FACHB-1365]MBD2484080.1 hypothetical protein [Planktothrix sp. FACHB-1365]